MNPTSPQFDPNQRYDRAITLMQYYAQLLWVVLSAFLLAETVLLGAIAQVAKDGPDSFVFGGAILGLFLVVPWWTSYRYNHGIYLLRIYEARALEPAVDQFFTNGNVLIETGETPVDKAVTIPWLARRLKPRHAVILLIILFAAAFLLVAVTHLPGTWRELRLPAPATEELKKGTSA
jgi:hypothetical protein